MEKDRSRGIKHIKDKQKYKGNSTKNPKYTAPKTKPLALASNWDRYELEDIDDNALTSSTNFELLANTPISTGSFYESKTNQVLDEEIQKQKSSSNLFCLDLDMLQRSVAAVPFYERIGISKEYFTEQEISEFDEDAAKNLEKLDGFLKTLKSAIPTHSQRKNNNVDTDDQKSRSSSSFDSHENSPMKNIQQILEANETDKSPSSEEKTNIVDLINNLEIEDLIEEQQGKEIKKLDKKTDKKGSQDLEEWLDDILDD